MTRAIPRGSSSERPQVESQRRPLPRGLSWETSFTSLFT
jgi:hypothetical protein